MKGEDKGGNVEEDKKDKEYEEKEKKIVGQIEGN